MGGHAAIHDNHRQLGTERGASPYRTGKGYKLNEDISEET